MKRTGVGDRVLMIFIYLFLIVLSFSSFYPFWNALVISFNLGADTSMGGVTFWPRAFTLENYQIVLNDDRILNGFVISVLRTIAGTISAIFMTSLLAYGLSRSNLMGRSYYMVYFIVTMYFSGGLIPTFLVVRSLGLMDNFLVFILPVVISVWNMIIFRTFFKQLPAGLEESAQIDGCSSWGIFFRIILPLSGPVLATLGLFTAIAHWNDWFLPSIYISKDHLFPIQTLLRYTINTNIVTEQSSLLDSASMAILEERRTITSKSLTMAMMMVVTIPIMLVYPFLQKYFVKGVMIGSLKE
ncbi:carbohydrate ABC transporter permease [Paenibacillus sp. NPDC058071]|uniref:carbohydrate ABC transporter permease n=1 Tax=Paenibacillus sp. NPDC058071 TaxID=3346326 RepID=UPI0036DCA595